MPNWRLAGSLEVLLKEFNAMAPNRSKASDGTIGDPAHASRCSRHNPNPDDVVCALDVTHDPGRGCNVHGVAREVVELARQGGSNPDLEYIISNGYVAKRGTGFKWERYTGTSPHDKHAHFAVGRGNDCPAPSGATKPYDTRTPWGVWPKQVPGPTPSPGDKMQLEPLNVQDCKIIAEDWYQTYLGVPAGPAEVKYVTDLLTDPNKTFKQAWDSWHATAKQNQNYKGPK